MKFNQVRSAAASFRNTMFVVVASVMLSQCSIAQTAKPADVDPDFINADRPGIADGSNVIGKGRIQLELGVQHELHRDNGADTHLWTVPTLLRYGLTNKTELRIETSGLSFVHYSGTNQPSDRTSGYSPISIGFKHHLQEGQGDQKASIGVLGRLFLPSGSSDFKSKKTTGDLRLALDKDITPTGNWSINPNIGVGFYEDGNGNMYTTALAAVTLGYLSPNKRFNPFIDFGLQGNEEKQGKTSMIVDAGVAFIVGKDMQLDASVGVGVLGSTTPHPFWSVGISRRF